MVISGLGCAGAETRRSRWSLLALEAVKNAGNYAQPQPKAEGFHFSPNHPANPFISRVNSICGVSENHVWDPAPTELWRAHKVPAPRHCEEPDKGIAGG